MGLWSFLWLDEVSWTRFLFSLAVLSVLKSSWLILQSSVYSLCCLAVSIVSVFLAIVMRHSWNRLDDSHIALRYFWNRHGQSYIVWMWDWIRLCYSQHWKQFAEIVLSILWMKEVCWNCPEYSLDERRLLKLSWMFLYGIRFAETILNILMLNKVFCSCQCFAEMGCQGVTLQSGGGLE